MKIKREYNNVVIEDKQLLINIDLCHPRTEVKEQQGRLLLYNAVVSVPSNRQNRGLLL